ncbi:hypothetical protein TNCV_1625241 [Trichonephila clavipes]|nr:hypothetical protein TNCV_1625241 [Trichonephila clavipes]
MNVNCFLPLLHCLPVTRKFPIHSYYFRRQGYLSPNLEGFQDQKYNFHRDHSHIVKHRNKFAHYTRPKLKRTRFLTSTACFAVAIYCFGNSSGAGGNIVVISSKNLFRSVQPHSCSSK